MSVLPRRLERPPEGPTVGVDLVRLGLLLVAATVLQTAVAPNIRVLGANPDFVLIAVVCVGLLRGSETGALFGFIAGVLVSAALFEPLGVGSFVLVIVGYFSGRYAETADLSSGFAPLVAVFAASLVAETMAGLVQFLFGREAPLDYVAVRVLLPGTVLNTLLAVPIYIVARAWLRGEGVGRAPATR